MSDTRYPDGNRIRLYAAIGAQLKRRREELGLTMRAMAETIGTTHGAVSNFEDGALAQPIHILVAYAEAFDCSLDAIVPVLIDQRAAS